MSKFQVKVSGEVEMLKIVPIIRIEKNGLAKCDQMKDNRSRKFWNVIKDLIERGFNKAYMVKGNEGFEIEFDIYGWTVTGVDEL